MNDIYNLEIEHNDREPLNFFIVRGQNDIYYLCGGRFNKKYNITRRFDFSNNYKYLLCENCTYREFSYEEAKKFYIKLTKLLLIEINSWIDNIFKKTNNLVKSIKYKNVRSKVLNFNIDSINNNKKKYILFFNHGMYLGIINSLNELYEDNEIPSIFIQNIRYDNGSYSFRNYLSDIEKYYSNYNNIVENYSCSYIFKNRQYWNLQNLFFHPRQFRCKKISLRLIDETFFNINSSKIDEDLSNFLNNSILKLKENLEIFIEREINKILLKENYCRLCFYDGPMFSNECKLGQKLVNKELTIEKIIKNNNKYEDLFLSFINKSIKINEKNEIIFNNNLLPIELNNLFILRPLKFPLSKPNKIYDEILLVRYNENELFESYKIGNVFDNAIICKGNIEIDLDNFFNDFDYNIHKFFNSIYNCEFPDDFFLLKNNLYINNKFKVKKESLKKSYPRTLSEIKKNIIPIPNKENIYITRIELHLNLNCDTKDYYIEKIVIFYKDNSLKELKINI